MRFANFSFIALTTLSLAILVTGLPQLGSAQTEDPFAGDADPFGSDYSDDDPFGKSAESNADPFGISDSSDADPFATASRVQVKVTTDEKPESQSASANRQNKVRILTAADIEEKLTMPMSLEYEEVAFIEVMDELRDHFGINVVLDQSARDDSLTEDELITCYLRDITLADGLKLLLREKNATYLVGPGYLRFISMDVAQDPEFHRRQIFDCRNILAKIATSDKRVGKAYPIQNYRRGQAFSGGSSGGGVFNVGPQLGGGGGGGGGGGFGGGGGARKKGFRSAEHQIIQTGQAPEIVNASADEAAAAKPQRKVEMLVHRVTAEGLLMELIKSSIAADSWAETNGDATISIISGLMVVTHDQETLEDIDRFLTELEQMMK